MEKQFGYAYWQKRKKQREVSKWLSKIGSWIVFILTITGFIYLINIIL